MQSMAYPGIIDDSSITIIVASHKISALSEFDLIIETYFLVKGAWRPYNLCNAVPIGKSRAAIPVNAVKRETFVLSSNNIYLTIVPKSGQLTFRPMVIQSFFFHPRILVSKTQAYLIQSCQELVYLLYPSNTVVIKSSFRGRKIHLMN